MDYFSFQTVLLVIVQACFRTTAEQLQIRAEFSTTKLKFTDASSRCSLLGSTTQSKNVEDVKLLSIPDNTGGTDLFWINAQIRQTPWFVFEGCSILHRSRFSGNMTSSKNSPAECWRYCSNFNYFGLMAQTCVCLQSFDQNLQILDCYHNPCPGDKNTVCGLTDGKLRPKLFVYRVKTLEDVFYDIGGRDCIALTRTGSGIMLGAFPCTETFGYYYRDMNGEKYFSNMKVTWIQAVQHNTDSLTIDKDIVVSNYPFQTTGWIGISRKTELFLTNNISNNCVAVSVSTEGILTPNVKNCSEEHLSLCQLRTASKNETLGQNHSATGVRLILPIIFGAVVSTVLIVTIVLIIAKRRKQRQRLLSSSAARQLLREDSTVWGTRINSSRDVGGAAMNQYEYSEMEMQRVSVAADSSYHELVLHKVEELDSEVFEKYDHIHVNKCENVDSGHVEKTYDHVETMKN